MSLFNQGFNPYNWWGKGEFEEGDSAEEEQRIALARSHQDELGTAEQELADALAKVADARKKIADAKKKAADAVAQQETPKDQALAANVAQEETSSRELPARKVEAQPMSPSVSSVLPLSSPPVSPPETREETRETREAGRPDSKNSAEGLQVDAAAAAATAQVNRAQGFHVTGHWQPNFNGLYRSKGMVAGWPYFVNGSAKHLFRSVSCQRWQLGDETTFVNASTAPEELRNVGDGYIESVAGPLPTGERPWTLLQAGEGAAGSQLAVHQLNSRNWCNAD